MLFYLILIFISAQMFCVIGLKNDYEDETDSRRLLRAKSSSSGSGVN